jgi:thioredoxin 1
MTRATWNGATLADAAWYYPSPSVAARKVEGRIAFWRGVQIVDDTGTDWPRPGLIGRLRRRLGSPLHDHGRGHERSDDVASAIAVLEDASFEGDTAGAWTVVDFWAPWCGPCRAFHPVFEQVALETPGVRFARCNVDDNPRSASAVGILSIPTVVLFDPDGNEVDRLVGVPARKDLALLLARASSSSGSVA